MTREKTNKAFATDADQLVRFCMIVNDVATDVKGTEQENFGREIEEG